MAIRFQTSWETSPVNAGWQVYEYPSNNPNAASRSTEHPSAGTWGCRFILNSTDNNAQYGNRRVEFTKNNSTNPDTSYRWYGFTWYFPSATMPSDNRECVLIQWHDKVIARPPGIDPDDPDYTCSVSPFLAIEAKNDRFRAMVRYNTTPISYCENTGAAVLQIFDMGPIPKDQHVSIVIYYDPKVTTDGRAMIWINGELKLDYTGRCFANGSYFPYLKFGIYKWLWNGTAVVPGSMTIFADDFKIGDINSSYAEVFPSVGGGSNLLPIVSAGSNQVYPSSTTSVSVTGTASDTDGVITGVLWTLVSGPNTPTIVSPTSLTTNITGLIPGNYVFRLTATDDDGAVASATKNIRINTLPTINLSGNPTNYPVGTTSVNLTSIVSDPDGTITSYSWAQVEGNPSTIVSPTSQNTTVTGLTSGTYRYRFSVSDNDGEIAIGEIVIVIAELTGLRVYRRVQAGV